MRLSYEDWRDAVIKKPFGSGWAGVGLVVTTIGTLVATLFLSVPWIAEFRGVCFGKYVLVLLFVGFAMLVFYLLSRFFYTLYAFFSSE